MADQKEQGTDSPAENPAVLPLKKRSKAEKLLVGYNRAPESSSESDGDGSDDVDKLQELQIKAFDAVLQVFTLETSTMSNTRTWIIKELMKEWEIAEETHITIADKIQRKLLILQQTEESSDDTEMQEASFAIDATPLSSIAPSSVKSWGSVKPESLVGKCVRIRVDEYDGEFVEYIITTYDEKLDLHRIWIPALDSMENDDPYWVDLRDFSPKDIMWEGGERPNFNAPN